MSAHQSHSDTPAYDWYKSSYSSGDNNCLETARQPGTVPVRDSKNPQLPALIFTAGAWSAFVSDIKRSAH